MTRLNQYKVSVKWDDIEPECRYGGNLVKRSLSLTKENPMRVEYTGEPS